LRWLTRENGAKLRGILVQRKRIEGGNANLYGSAGGQGERGKKKAIRRRDLVYEKEQA